MARNLERLVKTQDVVIANGANLSAAFYLGESVMLVVHMPAAWT